MRGNGNGDSGESGPVSENKTVIQSETETNVETTITKTETETEENAAVATAFQRAIASVGDLLRSDCPAMRGLGVRNVIIALREPPEVERTFPFLCVICSARTVFLCCTLYSCAVLHYTVP